MYGQRTGGGKCLKGQTEEREREREGEEKRRRETEESESEGKAAMIDDSVRALLA